MSAIGARSATALQWLCGAAALLPPLAVAAVVARYHVQVPYQDQWDLVPLLDSTYLGWPALADLLAQHNEHRPFFPRLVFLSLARASSWDIRWELAASLVTAGVIYALLVRAATRTRREAGLEPAPIVWPALSLLVFSLAQSENWLWGWQLQIFLCVAGALGGLLALGFGGAAYRAVALAIAGGTLASWSFASGLLFWPIGLLSLLAADDAWPRRLRRAGLFALAGAANGAVYLEGWRAPPHHPSPLLALQYPAPVTEYALHAIGSPLASQRQHAALAGAAGVLLLAYLVTRLRAGDALRRPSVRAWLSIATYALVCAVIVAVGRGFGTVLPSRYVTLAVPLWAAVVTLLFALPGSHDETGTARLRGRVHALIAFSILGLATVRSASSLDAYRAWHDRLEPAREVLVSGRAVPVLHDLHTLESLERGVPIARARRWSCFSALPPEAPAP